MWLAETLATEVTLGTPSVTDFEETAMFQFTTAVTNIFSIFLFPTGKNDLRLIYNNEHV